MSGFYIGDFIPLKEEKITPLNEFLKTGVREIKEKEKSVVKVTTEKGPGITFSLKSDEERKAFTLKKGEKITIGRTTTNEYVIEDISVSREHAEITFNGKDVCLKDKSSSGTFVAAIRNGIAVIERVGKDIPNPYKLKDGELIRFGEKIITFNFCEN